MTGKLIQLRPDAGIDELGDEGLAAACATGDRAAQSLVFERHVAAVYRFVARMRGSDPTSIDDLVQATFIEAFRSASRFRGPRLQSWLFGIAANVLRSHVRREISRKRVLALAAAPEPSALHDEQPDLAKLQAAIAALPRKLREVIVLVDLEGESGPDAAAALGIGEATLWRRLARAREKLRAALGGDR
jgi:RNA polymerase sigma-70 factor (ECF subfamily)